jgi:hypothetical protein
MSALLLGALQATGCIFVSDDTGDDVPSGTASIDFGWTIYDGDATAACPAGATTAALIADGATRYEDLYDCADLAGTMTDLPLDTYTIWIDFTDDGGTTLFAQSEAVEVNLDSDGEVATALFDVDGFNGFLDVSWTIAGSTCESTEDVSVLSTLAGTTEGFDDVFTCTDGEAPNVVTTAPLPIGDYVIAIALLNAAQESIGSAPTIQESIAFGNEFVDLGTVTINLD